MCFSLEGFPTQIFICIESSYYLVLPRGLCQGFADGWSHVVTWTSRKPLRPSNGCRRPPRVWELRCWLVGFPHVRPLVQVRGTRLFCSSEAIRETRFILLFTCRLQPNFSPLSPLGTLEPTVTMRSFIHSRMSVIVIQLVEFDMMSECGNQLPERTCGTNARSLFTTWTLKVAKALLPSTQFVGQCFARPHTRAA